MNSLSPIWHPITQHAVMQPEIPIERAQGAYLYTKDGRRIIDAISSWWVITHGHCHPAIVKAVQEQAERLEQVIFAGFTHAPAEELTKKLLKMTPPKSEFAFFSDSGSTAVEVALKMAIGYWQHKGEKRSKIIALEDGYHGDTFGAMAASGRSVYTKYYEQYLFDVCHVPPPLSGTEDRAFYAYEEILSSGDVAAVIVEPLVQGAGGMRFYSPESLKRLYDLAQQNGALFIADEVMTGFGRTGSLFASNQAGIEPDIICLSKGLTAGFLPMGITMASREVYDAFYDRDRAKTFFHSTSFTGNPITCAAALANLRLWDDEPVLENIQRIASLHKSAVIDFQKRESVMNARSCGTIFALEIKDKINGYLSNLAPKLHHYYTRRNILLRPMGNTVYILPPYCTSDKDLAEIYGVIHDSLNIIESGGNLD